MATTEISSSVISIDREIVSGTPCFSGTRVPLRALFDYVEGGHIIEEFLADFPSVTSQQAHQVLRDASAALQDIADRPFRDDKRGFFSTSASRNP
jgi:uncharacterized protein (DUF433 family)